MRSAQYGREVPSRQLDATIVPGMLLLMRQRILISCGILLLGVSAQVMGVDPTATPKPSAETALEGVISIGPVKGGPQRQGETNSRPLADTEFDVQYNANVVASIKTNGEGRFRIALPAGHYRISRKGSTSGMGHCSFEVDLAPGQVKQVQWECDTGIR